MKLSTDIFCDFGFETITVNTKKKVISSDENHSCWPTKSAAKYCLDVTAYKDKEGDFNGKGKIDVWFDKYYYHQNEPDDSFEVELTIS